VAVHSIDGVEGDEIHLLDGVDDEPREVVLGQPLAQRARHQKGLLTTALDETPGMKMASRPRLRVRRRS
jgi:hypothetical protein